MTLNEYIDAERTSKFKAATIKKQQTNSVAYLAKSQKFKLDPKKYDVVFNWFKPNNNRDHDNIAFCKKFVLDGLIVSGALPNDGPKYIGDFQDKFFTIKKHPWVSCMVEFIEINNN